MKIDFHCHAFPDALAQKAITNVTRACGMKPHGDGTLRNLLDSMDKTGIDKGVICSVATKTGQFEGILEWSSRIRSSRIIPLLSLHPEDIQRRERIAILDRMGFKGIKIHPYYQECALDDKKMDPVFEEIASRGLLAVSHTGFDLGSRERLADPEKVARIYARFPGIKLIASHTGAYQDWEEVEKHIIGREIYFELSFAHLVGKERLLRFLTKHPSEYILFGTDYPWADQQELVSFLDTLEIPEKLKKKFYHTNPLRLLGN